MTMTSESGPTTGASACRVRRNPFATRHTRPGRLSPRDAFGEPFALAELLERLAAGGGSGALEGPHGSGKTTLLVALAEVLRAEGRLGGLVRLRTPRDAGEALRLVARAQPRTTVCIDSWERMGPIAGVVTRWTARRRGCGLLVTSHRRTGLPVIVECRTSISLLSALVAALPDHGGVIAEADVVAAHAAHGGNLREALLGLYDLFESRVR